MSDDKTFCLNWKGCRVVRCERDPSNIQEKEIPHSFAELYMTDCCPLTPKWTVDEVVKQIPLK